MSNSVVTTSAEDGLSALPTVGSSAGMTIRSARLAAGINIEHLSGILKVTPKKLEALENDHWVEVGDPVFVRALASSVAKHLKINQAALLAQLPVVAQAPKLNEQLLDGPPSKGFSFEQPSKKKYVYAIAAFLFLSLLMIWIPDAYLSKEKWQDVTSNLAWWTSKKPSSPTEFREAVTPTQDTNTPNSQEGAVASVINRPASEPAVAAAEPLVAASSSPVLPMTTASSATTPSSPSSPPISSQHTANDTLVLSATESSWVEVRDHQGQLKLQRLLNKGETVGLSGGLPYSVVIGRSDLVMVQFQGKPFDMTPFAKNNVARFQLK